MKQMKKAPKAAKKTVSTKKVVNKRKFSTKKKVVKKKTMKASSAAMTTTFSSQSLSTSPIQSQFSMMSTSNNIMQRFAPVTTLSAQKTLGAKSITATTTSPFTLSLASISTKSFRPLKSLHPLAAAAPLHFPTSTGLSSHITSQISNVSFLPLKIQKRGFLGNIGAGLGNMFGGAGAKKPDDPSQHGIGSMMEMMEMMKMMQKITNMVKTGQPSEAEYQEILGFITKLRTQRGGNLPPEIDGLLDKIQKRQPISQDEVMCILGINPTEAAELREITIGVKNGSVNQMTYMMKIAEIFQRAQQRKEAGKDTGAAVAAAAAEETTAQIKQ